MLNDAFLVMYDVHSYSTKYAIAFIKWNALKCQEPLPALMQMSTCAYLISTCGIRRACHFSQNG